MQYLFDSGRNLLLHDGRSRRLEKSVKRFCRIRAKTTIFISANYYYCFVILSNSLVRSRHNSFSFVRSCPSRVSWFFFFLLRLRCRCSIVLRDFVIKEKVLLPESSGCCLRSSYGQRRSPLQQLPRHANNCCCCCAPSTRL